MYEIINNPPDAKNIMNAASAMGNYNLANSLADLIDNSITAEATEVYINASFNGIDSEIRIIDNGLGMSEEKLKIAMRMASFNPEEDRNDNDLGRFGLGLKTASYSHCRILTVLTYDKHKFSGLKSNLHDHNDFKQFLFSSEDDVKKFMTSPEDENTKTEIIWNNLRDFTEGGTIPEYHWDELLVEAKNKLRLIFHRYLDGEGQRKLKIFFNGDDVQPIDPFGKMYEATTQLPKEKILIKNKNIIITPFILPHSSKLTPKEHDELGGKEGWLKNQGFYIYRNLRLIIHGTWFDLTSLKDHVKLARVRIDIPNSLDLEWKITVDKSQAQLPLTLRKRLKEVLDKIIQNSQKVYAHKGKKLTNSKISSIWDLKKSHGEYTFDINRGHPYIKSFVEALSKEKKVKFLQILQLIQGNIPLHTIYSEMSDNPLKVNQKNDDPIKSAKFSEIFYQEELSKGKDARKITLKLLETSNPFLEHKDYIINYFKKKGIDLNA